MLFKKIELIFHKMILQWRLGFVGQSLFTRMIADNVAVFKG